MAWVNVVDDVPVQEGTFAYSYRASGNIKKGQAVYPVQTMDMTVRAVNARDLTNVVGIAAFDVAPTIANPKWIGVYGPGNVVRCSCSGSITAGNHVTATKAGRVYAKTVGTHTIGVALENKTTGDIKVLLI